MTISISVQYDGEFMPDININILVTQSWGNPFQLQHGRGFVFVAYKTTISPCKSDTAVVLCAV